MRKLRSDERICDECGKIFRVKRKRGKPRHYCSKSCADEVHKRQMNHRNSLGTNTISLSEKSIKKQLNGLKDYKKKRNVNYDVSSYDILISKTVYCLDDDNNEFESIEFI